MMYLSQLLIDTGGNPDRPRPGRMWLNNIYNVHRRLCMAFPAYKRDHPDFLQPFNPAHYKHAERPFLYRVDHNIKGDSSRAIIIVQSELLPDWDWCFHNAPDFLAAPPNTNEFAPVFQAGQELRFRIRINPSTKKYVYADKNNPPPKDEREHKRVSVTWDSGTTPDEAMGDWFVAKSAGKGFTPLKTELLQLGWVYGSKPYPKDVKPKENGQGYWREHDYHKMRYRSVTLEGYLRIDDPKLFSATISTGIGSAKSMGFGLLSLAPVNYA